MYVSLENTHTQLWIHTMSQIQIHPHKFLSWLPHSTFVALLLHSDNTCSHQYELMHLLLNSILNLKGFQKGFSQKKNLLERVQDMFAVLSISPALQDCVYLVQYPVFINNFNQLFPPPFTVVISFIWNTPGFICFSFHPVSGCFFTLHHCWFILFFE